ncbi:39S ribosomal protein L34, mitochondrial [Engraulis encrasicolus]|uniref:39S ribosomal protein L34, mitochondrial n=1 Tax=Engraulis encrasicolus TaxID=184585 RepID=UPI002FCEB328
MNIINSAIVRFSALNILRGTVGKSSPLHPSLQQTLCRWSHLHVGKEQRVCSSGLPFAKLQGGPVYKQPTWHHQQIRTVKRGTEYQPKNIKRKRTHGWLKRISTQGGIEVILRRMLKGRKSLTH